MGILVYDLLFRTGSKEFHVLYIIVEYFKMDWWNSLENVFFKFLLLLMLSCSKRIFFVSY